MTNAPNHAERLLELLADQATGMLSTQEQAELDRLLAAGPARDAGGRVIGRDDVDRVIGEMLAAYTPREAMPLPLRAKLLAQGEQAMPAAAAPARPSAFREWGGWLAAAAAVLLGALGWLRAPAPTPTLHQQVEALIAESETMRVAWTSPGDPAGAKATGEVIWNNRLQKGYLRISGLAANDATVEQYQLWIIDKGRSDPQPVDGGVFDIPGTGTQEVLIPIHAAIPVRTPAAFAVTVEKPGGVVVSKQERVPLLAQPKG